MSAEKGLEQLAEGYLRHPANDRFRQRLRDGLVSPADLGRQLRIVAYRIVVAAAFGANFHDAVAANGTFKPCPPWLEDAGDLDRAQISGEDVDAAVESFAIDRTKSDELGRIHLELLDLEPRISVDEGIVKMVPSEGRHSSGVFYTPDILVDCLLDHSLEPAIEAAVAGKSPEEAEHAVLALKILDPAVGSGRFLIAAARRLTRRVAQFRSSRRMSSLTAARTVVENCLFGVDIDAGSVDLARIALWLEAGRPEVVSKDWPKNLRVGNALAGATEALVAGGIPDRAYDAIAGDEPRRCAELRKQNRAERPGQDSPPVPVSMWTLDVWCAAHTVVKSHSGPVPTNATLTGSDVPTDMRQVVSGEKAAHLFFHWPLEFPGEGFDVVVGNPPFANAIERDLEDRTAGIVAARTALVGGTGDLAYRFLVAATEWIRPGGWIAMIQPRAALNARALDRFRLELPDGLSPRMLCAMDRADHFRGADVFVALIVLGPLGPCKVPAPGSSSLERWTEVQPVSTNWYVAARGRGEPKQAGLTGRPLGEIFDIAASMTTSEAYAAKPHITDLLRGRGQKLMTTGLIDPGKSLWGTEDCRYLRSRFRHPRLTAHAAMPGSLQRRLRTSVRPKVLVGGLGSRVEAFFDERGECQGAVSTYSIFHPSDDPNELKRVCEYLNTPAVTERLRNELGANALGGGSITIKKHWLRQLSMDSLEM